MIVIDGERKESGSVLFEFKKLSDAVHIEKELDDAQLYGDIKNPYPVDMPKVKYTKLFVLHSLCKIIP